MTRFHARHHVVAFSIVLAATLVASSATAGGTAQPGSSAHGHSLPWWLQTHFAAQIAGTTGQEVDHVRMLELPTDVTYDGGSFTSADPGHLTGTIDVTVEPGTPFYLPVVFWYGERYDPGMTGGQPDDPEIPAGLFTNSACHVTMDGQDLINSDDGNLADWYSPPTYYEPPLYYNMPTGYGSVATLYVQGIGFVHRPLNPGVHVLHLESEFIALIPDYFGTGFDLDVGVQRDNTWTITVTK